MPRDIQNIIYIILLKTFFTFQIEGKNVNQRGIFLKNILQWTNKAK